MRGGARVGLLSKRLARETQCHPIDVLLLVPGYGYVRGDKSERFIWWCPFWVRFFGKEKMNMIPMSY